MNWLYSLKAISSPLLKSIGNIRRKSYLLKKRARNKNLIPTIFANNCIGGIMYHDLKLRFMSPTINIWIPDKDFFEFLSDPLYYSTHAPIEIFEEGISYPIGRIQKDDAYVTLYFVHYDTFEDAKNKWLERGQRIDLSNTYVVMEHAISPSDAFLNQFKSFSYNKRLLTYMPDTTDPEIVHCDIFANNYKGGTMIKYPHLYSKARNLDVFDYVSFLNN